MNIWTLLSATWFMMKWSTATIADRDLVGKPEFPSSLRKRHGKHSHNGSHKFVMLPSDCLGWKIQEFTSTCDSCQNWNTLSIAILLTPNPCCRWYLSSECRFIGPFLPRRFPACLGTCHPDKTAARLYTHLPIRMLTQLYLCLFYNLRVSVSAYLGHCCLLSWPPFCLPVSWQNWLPRWWQPSSQKVRLLYTLLDVCRSVLMNISDLSACLNTWLSAWITVWKEAGLILVREAWR
jgi:hypothetical protein